MSKVRIFTSYYANKQAQSSEYTQIGISIGKNRWAKVDIYLTNIAPTWDMVKLTDQEVYRKLYFEKLDTVGVDNIRESFESISSEKPLVLLCYENISKPGQWCHRTMFAEWWKEKTGEVIEELPIISAKKNKNILFNFL
jgi:hypothetical protein